MDVVMFFLTISLSFWVYGDARSIGVKKGQLPGLGDMSPFGWLICCLLLLLVAFPLYLVKRPQFQRINAPSAESDVPAPSPPDA